MPLTPTDQNLLKRCLAREYGAWNDFVDRFLGLIYHVIHYTAHQRSVPLAPEDVEDIAADIMLQIVADDYAVLRNFRRRSSLAAYLTVIARRICVHELNRRANVRETQPPERKPLEAADDRVRAHRSLEGLEEVQQLLRKLPAREREVVRLFYLEGRTYEEISTRLHIPVNTIGPILSRARKRLRAVSNGQARVPRKAGEKRAEEKKPEEKPG